MTKILLLEDDENLGASLQKYLSDENYEVSWVKSIEEAKSKINDPYSVAIVDWMLPDGQGIDFLKDLRAQSITVPVMMLTARTDLIDKVIGLESGANDYITKPFEPRELLARVRAQLRSAGGHEGHAVPDSDQEIKIAELVINKTRREVFFNDSQVDLTKMEFEFLSLLAESPNRAFSRDEILNKVWGYEHFPTTRTVDTHVLQLRQKLRDDLIETVRGIGYRLRFNG